MASQALIGLFAPRAEIAIQSLNLLSDRYQARGIRKKVERASLPEIRCWGRCRPAWGTDRCKVRAFDPIRLRLSRPAS